jgi:polyphosphate kinase
MSSEETMAINLPQSVDNFAADRFLDRELSWLAFNQRVLEMAEDPKLYLLERVNFLAIFASNLDEFFMVRVAGLKRRIATGLAITSASGLSPQEVLTQISVEAHRLQERHAKVFIDDIKPQLKEKGIKVVRWAALEESEKASLGEYFQNQIFPVLTPLAVDPAHPFPSVSYTHLRAHGTG